MVHRKDAKSAKLDRRGDIGRLRSCEIFDFLNFSSSQPHNFCRVSQELYF